jgi:hypothetical protein
MHADCPGRAVYVHVDRGWDSEQWEAGVVEVCTDYRTHGYTAPSDEWRTTTSSKKKPVV